MCDSAFTLMVSVAPVAGDYVAPLGISSKTIPTDCFVHIFVYFDGLSSSYSLLWVNKGSLCRIVIIRSPGILLWKILLSRKRVGEGVF